MKNPRDNMVYVVSLSKASIKEDGTITWIDVVETGRCYCPSGMEGLAKRAPHYIAFDMTENAKRSLYESHHSRGLTRQCQVTKNCEVRLKSDLSYH